MQDMIFTGSAGITNSWLYAIGGQNPGPAQTATESYNGSTWTAILLQFKYGKMACMQVQLEFKQLL
jgi:hypothetical protein